jgi:protein TonB
MGGGMDDLGQRVSRGVERARGAASWPFAVSLAAHGAAFGLIAAIPSEAPPKPREREIAQVTLHVRPRALVRPAHAPSPHARPAPVIAPEPERIDPPRRLRVRRLAASKKAPHPSPRLDAVRAPAAAPPKLGALDLAKLEGLATLPGDPHGAPHAHPHAPLELSPPPTLLDAPEPAPSRAAEPPPRKSSKPTPPARVTLAWVRPEVVAAKLLSRRPEPLDVVRAEYPEDARRAGLEGMVVLSLLINDAGRVKDARVRKPLGMGCDEAAQKALLRSRFSPPLGPDGKPCSTRVTYGVRFSLD